jgi:F-type H+-transporting ATPase subunit b
MSVNWINVIATIINFLVLVFLLRRFLYRPILKVMDEREQKIVQREEEAAAKARLAEAEAGAYRDKTASLANRDEQLLGEAREAAAAERRSLVDEARREVAETRQGWQEALSREKESFARELRREVAGQTCRIARRCLQDLADARLEEMAWDIFFKKVGALPAEDLANLKEALAAAGAPIQVNSAFEIDETNLALLKSRLAELLSVDVSLEYGQDPSLVCGLELEAGGHRVSWSVDNYLDGVEQQILQSLETAEQVKEEAADVS